MHIVIDAHLAVREIDGVARYLIGLLQELPKLDAKIAYTILCLPDRKSGIPADIFSPENVTKVQIDLMGPSPKQHVMIPPLLRELKADLYHHPQYDLPFGLSLPTVATIHDLKYIYYPQYLSRRSRLKSFYIKRSLRYTLAHATHVIAVSEHTHRDIKRFAKRPIRNVTVVHHGVNSDTGKAPAAGNFTLDSQRDFVLFVGTRRPHKNIEGLIRALERLRTKHNCEIDLVVAGKAYSEYKRPENLVQQLGLADRVHFLDFVADDALPSLYHAARIVALPSFYEGFGFPVLEAMVHGKPFVGSNVSSIPEVVGDAGLLFDPNQPDEIAEKIVRILSDNQLEEDLRKRALQRARLFSWQSVAEKTLQVYLDAYAAFDA